MSRRRLVGLAATLAAALAFAVLVMLPDLWERLLAPLAGGAPTVLYPTATLGDLVVAHLALVGVASALTVLVGLPLGVWVTRPSGQSFRPLVSAAVDLGQTFPPVAVLVLALPALGFGFTPTIVALFLYGLFPVVSGTIAGLEAVPPAVLDAARGMGMSPRQVLLRVELPLAARLILAGIRTSVVFTIGTATVGAAVGASGLGVPIVGGLVSGTGSYVLEGAIAAAAIAILADLMLAQLEAAVTPAEGS